MTIAADYIAASQASCAHRYSVSKTYQSIPESQGLEWTDGFFVEEEGVVAVFDFDYAQMVDFDTKTNAVAQLCCIGWLAAYCGFFAGPLGLIAPAAYTVVSMWPCFLRPQMEWHAHSQHVAVTRDGIRFVRDKRKSCWGCSICDQGRHSKTLPFDKITDCDIVEPAGSVCLCIPRVLMTVNVDTASSGGDGKRVELSLVGLKEAHKFKQLVWGMKRSSRGGGNAYAAPQAQEIAERGLVTSQQAPGGEDKMEFLLRGIRDELRENNNLLREIKEGKSEPQGATTATADRARTALQSLEAPTTPEIV